jgi:hypothetical protein
VVSALTVLPVYPVSMVAGTPQPVINADSAETVGWPRFVREIARVYRTLPPAERSRTTLMMSNYGEAGAIDRYGPEHGLPRAYSPHNGYWHFGRPPESDGPVIVVGPEEGEGPGRLALYWQQVTMAGRIDNGVDLDNEEQGKPVWICRGQREPWSTLWPKLKTLS